MTVDVVELYDTAKKLSLGFSAVIIERGKKPKMFKKKNLARQFGESKIYLDSVSITVKNRL